MKKLTTIFTACLFVFALSSCGGNDDGSDNSDKSENPAHGETDHTCDATVEGCDGYLSPLEKEAIAMVDCFCEYQGMLTKMSDSDNLDDLSLQIEEQSVKCEDISKKLDDMIEAVDDAAREGAMLLMDKEMQDCEYQ